MKRVNVFLPEQLIARLKEQSRMTGLPVAEIIRRAVDDYLKNQRGDSP